MNSKFALFVRFLAPVNIGSVLSGVVCVICLSAFIANAEEPAKTTAVGETQTQMPAVDGVNVVIEVVGGPVSKKSLYGSGGLVSIPLGGLCGLEIIGAGGSFDGRGLGIAGINLFRRNPSEFRLGLVSNYLYFKSPIGALNAYRAGGDAELYFDRFTLSGTAGVSGYTAMDASLGSKSFQLPGKSRFFEEANFDYYPLDNLRLSSGQTYSNDKLALTLGAELGIPTSDRTIMAGLFIDSAIRSGSATFFGGVHFYFGAHEKSLLRRNREDDSSKSFNEPMMSMYSGVGPLPASN